MIIYCQPHSLGKNNEQNMLKLILYVRFVSTNKIKPNIQNKGLCTNHVDRIWGIFDPPPPFVDTFTK